MEKKWEATKRYFQDYKRFTRPFSVNLGAAIRGFDIDNIAAQQAIDESKALHARRWQTKEGTYWGGLCQSVKKPSRLSRFFGDPCFSFSFSFWRHGRLQMPARLCQADSLENGCIGSFKSDTHGEHCKFSAKILITWKCT